MSDQSRLGSCRFEVFEACEPQGWPPLVLQAFLISAFRCSVRPLARDAVQRRQCRFVRKSIALTCAAAPAVCFRFGVGSQQARAILTGLTSTYCMCDDAALQIALSRYVFRTTQSHRYSTGDYFVAKAARLHRHSLGGNRSQVCDCRVAPTVSNPLSKAACSISAISSPASKHCC